MGIDTKIQWTDHTFNPWWGCQRISPACENCYAEAFSHRLGGSPWAKGEHWGPGSLRTVASEKQWAQPVAWNAAAAKAGERRRVFCASMADVFEDRRDLDAPRARLWAIIEATPHLDWQLLTKRTDCMTRLAPERWAQAWPRNVWAGTTVEDQRRADERIPHLLRVPAAVRFLSMEPLLGPVDLSRIPAFPSPPWPESLPGEPATFLNVLTGDGLRPSWTGVSIETHIERVIDWLIVGGESGPGSRPFDLSWARRILAQAKDAGVAVFVKQLGSGPIRDAAGVTDGPVPVGWPATARMYSTDPALVAPGDYRPGNKFGDPAEWPADLRVREFPEVPRG